MEKVIGNSFEELTDQEMINVNGGATPATILTTWSSAPCIISASVATIVTKVFG